MAAAPGNAELVRIFEVSRAQARHLEANDPVSTIRRCDADLGILLEHKPFEGRLAEILHGDGPVLCWTCDSEPWPCRTLKLLAWGYDRDGDLPAALSL